MSAFAYSTFPTLPPSASQDTWRYETTTDAALEGVVDLVLAAESAVRQSQLPVIEL